MYENREYVSAVVSIVSLVLGTLQSGSLVAREPPPLQ